MNVNDSLSPHESSKELLARARRIVEGVVGIPATDGNRVEVLRNGDEIFPRMLEAISAARRSVDFLTFVYWKGQIGEEFAKRLSERASAGLRVRVLLDAWGAQPVERRLIDLMTSSGVRVNWFRPLHRLRPREVNHRTHRKILVIDETVGFTGGVGISDLWLGNARTESEWRDTHFRIEGPAVDGLRAAFLDNWTETEFTSLDSNFDQFPEQPREGTITVQCVRGSSSTNGSDLNALFETLLQMARRQFRVTTAYFVPDDDLVGRLCDAAGRGVTVQILLPGPHADKRFVRWEGESDYAKLMASGIELWNFQPSMLHAKIMTVDGLVANVGSANFNSRSLECDEEFNLVIFDPSTVQVLDKHFDADLQRSVRIDPLRWEHRSLVQRSVEHLVTPLRPIS